MSKWIPSSYVINLTILDVSCCVLLLQVGYTHIQNEYDHLTLYSSLVFCPSVQLYLLSLYIPSVTKLIK
jgi:hypothetical protein